MLRLPGAWLWDFWLAEEGDRYHLFFLFAPRDLEDERHRVARARAMRQKVDELQDRFRPLDTV